MASRFDIDQASVTDNDTARQVEFTADVDGDDREFAVRYAVLKELSGEDPESDALEIFERISDELVDICLEAAIERPSADLVVINKGDLE